jgi:hypothetical protein
MLGLLKNLVELIGNIPGYILYAVESFYNLFIAALHVIFTAATSLIPLPVMEKVRPVMIVFATIGIVLLFYRLAKGGSPASGGTGDAPGSTSTDESER